MSTAILTPDVTVDIAGTTIDAATEAQVSLDAQRVPYGEATVTVPLTDLAVVEAIDPRRITRADVTVGVGAATRLLDLSVQAREVDHEGRTVLLELATDEAFAQQYTPLATDLGAIMYQESLRRVCDYVLARVPGIRQNVCPYPTAGSGSDWVVASWGTGGAGTSNLNATTGVGNTSPPIENMRAMSLSWTTAPSVSVGAKVDTGRFLIPTGSPMTFSGYLASTIAGATWRGVIQWYNASNTFLSSTVGDTITPTAGNRGRVTATGTPPAGATNALFGFQLMSGTIVVGSYAWFTAVQAEVSARATGWAENVLAPGTDDADMTAYWPLTNLMPNPAVRSITGNWIPGGANATMARMTTGIGAIPDAADVTTYMRTTWSGNSTLGQGGAYGQTATLEPFTPVIQGRSYMVSCWARANVAKTVDLRVQVFGRDGTVLNPGLIVSTVTLVANTWTKIIGEVETPPEAERLGPFLYANAATQWTSGNTLDTTCWMMHEDTGRTHVPFFDGATPNDANYTYAGTGAAHASASTRTPIIERSPDTFAWTSDTSAWDMLMPLAASAGLKLFCDENRVWRLVDPNTYTVAGSITAGTANGTTPANAVKGKDRIARDDEAWCTGVTVRYRWKDRWGIDREQFDRAGTSGRVRQVDLEQPYPGPGLAAQLLARALDQGRVTTITALADMSATPGQALAVTMPGTRPQRGRLSSVEWEMGDALMTVQGRNARTVPDAPAAPVATWVVTPTEFTITWTAPYNGGSPILGYELSIGTEDAGESVPATSPFTYNPWTSGDFQFAVRARNAIGWGPWSPYGYITVPA